MKTGKRFHDFPCSKMKTFSFKNSLRLFLFTSNSSNVIIFSTKKQAFSLKMKVLEPRNDLKELSMAFMRQSYSPYAWNKVHGSINGRPHLGHFWKVSTTVESHRLSGLGNFNNIPQIRHFFCLKSRNLDFFHNSY